MRTAAVLEPQQAEGLRALTPTFAFVGRWEDAPLTEYPRLQLSRRVRTQEGFELVGARLLSWQAHVRAGLMVATSQPVAAIGAVVVVSLRLGPVAVEAPCRVTTIIDEPARRGFAYATLPGHPESGEERFVLDRNRDGSIEFTVSACSRPAWRSARVLAPATRSLQRLIANRYLRSLDS